MRDPNRIPVILETLRKVWTRNPDMRLGQLIVNASSRVGYGQCTHEIFNVEDPILAAGLTAVSPMRERPVSTREDEACI